MTQQTSTNPLITNPMLSGIVERQMYVWATIAAGNIVSLFGLPKTDVEWIAGGILTAIAGAIGWYKGRPQTIAATVANLPASALAQPMVAAQVATAAGAIPNPEAPDGKTVVITSPEIAAATPTAPTVVSSVSNEVVSK